MNIENCTFNGVEFNADAIEAINTIALALKENAIALHKLSQVLVASNIHIDTMIKVDNGKE